MVTCPNCNGTGETEGPAWQPPINWSVETCPTCKGTGRVPNHMGRWAKCPKCEGWGKEPPLITSFTCSKCRGVGRLPAGRAL